MHKQLLIKKLLRYTRNLLIFYFTSTLLAVIIYRFMPVSVTPLMVIRSLQQVFSGAKPTWKHTWVSLDKISPNRPMAVIASEDNRFAEHNGFDPVSYTHLKSSYLSKGYLHHDPVQESIRQRDRGSNGRASQQ